jgi:hypothetical protein
MLQQRDYSHAGLEQMLRDVVEVNGDIFGPDTTTSGRPGSPIQWRRVNPSIDINRLR